MADQICASGLLQSKLVDHNSGLNLERSRLARQKRADRWVRWAGTSKKCVVGLAELFPVDQNRVPSLERFQTVGKICPSTLVALRVVDYNGAVEFTNLRGHCS